MKRLTSRRTSEKKRICAPRHGKLRPDVRARELLAPDQLEVGVLEARTPYCAASSPLVPAATISPLVDEGDPAAELLGLLEVVRRQQDRRALGVDPLDVVPQLEPQLDVDAGGRLVEDQQAGAMHQRAREDQPALHAARQRARAVIALLGQREGVEQLGDALAALALAASRSSRRGSRASPRRVRNQSRLRSCGARPTASRASLVVTRPRRCRRPGSRPTVGCASPVVQWISVDLPGAVRAEQPEELAVARSRARRPCSASVPVG